MTGIRNFLRTIGGALGLIGMHISSHKGDADDLHGSVNVAFSVWPHPKQYFGISSAKNFPIR